MGIYTIPPDVVRAGRATFSKTNFTVPSNARYVAQVGTFTSGSDSGGARVVTLPDAATFGAGQRLVIADESGSLRPWYRLALTPAGGNTINLVAAPKFMVYPEQTIDLVSTGAGWMVANDSAATTQFTDEAASGSRGLVLVDNDMGCIAQFNAVPDSLRVFAGNGAVFSTAYSAGALSEMLIAMGANAASSMKIGPSLSAAPNSVKTRHWMEAIVNVTTLPAGASAGVIDVGICEANTISNATLDPANGAAVRIQRSVSDTKYVMSSANGGLRTNIASALDFGAGLRRIGVELNDSYTAAHYWVGDFYLGSLGSNIPTSARSLTAYIGLQNTANVGINIDRLRYSYRHNDLDSRY